MKPLGWISSARESVTRWTARSTNRKIFSAAVLVGIGTLVVKAAAMGKELVVAYHFGTRDVLDAFYIAYLLPSFAVNVLAGALQSSFVPTYVEVRENHGSSAARDLFGSMMTLLTVGLLTVGVLLALASPILLPVLGSGFPAEKMSLTRDLFYLLLPVLLLKTLAQFWAHTMNAGEKFALPAFAPLAVPTFIVAALILFQDQVGVYALAGGLIAGTLGEAALVGWGLARTGTALHFTWAGVTGDLRQVGRQFAPMVVGALLMSSSDLVDQSMAAALGSGSVASLNYGNRVVAGVLALGSTAIGTAVLPHFSRLAARTDWEALKDTLRKYSRLILVVTVPLAILLVLLSEPIVRLLFERGAFGPEDTRLVGRVQALYLLQIPAYVLSVLLVRLVSSLKSNVYLMWGAALNLAANIALNLVFMQWLGVAGIALSTSVVYMISLFYLSLVLKRLLGAERR